MVDSWQRVKLSDVASHQKGFAFKSKDYQEIGTAIIRVSNFTSDSIDRSDLKFVSDEITIDSSKVKLQKNDVVIATVGSWPKNPASVVGKTIRVPSEVEGSLLNQNAVRFRVKTNCKLDQVYLYFLLKWNRFSDYIISTAQGSANQASITLKDIYNFEFDYPSKTIRHAIAQQLGSIDSKIELNRQTNQTLEKMAQALFKSWFVDFDPVIDNALAIGTSISDFPEPLQKRAELRKSVQLSADAKKLPEDIRKLFPSEFEESELGWVPKGWEVCSFESMINLIGGGTPKTTMDEYWSGDIPWFSVVDAPNDSDIFVIDTDKHVTQLGVDKSSTKILRVGTTIISARGTVGKCAMVATPMAMNQSCYGVVGKTDISDEYIYFQIRYQVSNLQKRSHGSIFSTITRDTFKSIKIAFCGDEITQIFKKVTESNFDKVLLNNKQNSELGKLRDILLPKLISGELKVN